MKRWLLIALLLGRPATAEPWTEFQLIMWQDQSPARMAGLARMGFTGTKLIASGGRIDPTALALQRASGLPYYLENIATDFYAPYHRFVPGRPVTWLFDALKAQRRRDPGDRSVFVRDPSLSDPAWLAKVEARLGAVVAAQREDRPLFYNLADEAGIGDLAAAWDADISAPSLEGMRAWLRTQYTDLDALNRQWGTAFTTWAEVQPELTDAALLRTDGNYSAWADFKAWMDAAFAAALRAGTDAVHRADPTARAALEGAQVPGWGGYDYGRLAGTVDVMEIYDYGNAMDLARAFNPALIPIRTSFSEGPREVHEAWSSFLRGSRGIVVWDEANDVVADDGSPGPRGRELSALVAEFRAIAPALWAAQPHTDPVGILYSQASFRTNWLLDRRIGGTWSDRDAEREYDDNAWRAGRRRVAQLLGEMGVAPRWLSSQGVERAALRDSGLRVLILPHAIALSDAEVAEIAAFAARGGAVLADTEPGQYDQHSRRRAALPLTGIARIPQPIRPDADPASPASLSNLATLLQEAGAAPALTLTGPDGQRASGVDIRLFHDGAVTTVALQTVQPFAGPEAVTLVLPIAAQVYDVRAGRALGRTDRIPLKLDPVTPTILTLTPMEP